MSPFAGHPGCLLAFAATDNVSVSYLVNLSLPACTSVYVSWISGFLGSRIFFLMFCYYQEEEKKGMWDKKEKKKCKM